MINRKQFEEAVMRSALNPYARFILMTYAARNNYNDKAEESWCSQAYVAKVTGIGKNTVGRYVEALVEDGWLIPASMHQRTQGYWLAEGVTTMGTLKKPTRGNQFTGNVPMEQLERPHGATPNVPMEQPERPHDGELRTIKNHIEEPIEEPKTVSDEPVASPKVEASPLVIEQEDEVKNYKELLENLDPPLSKDELDNIRFWKRNGTSLEKMYEAIIYNRNDPWI